VIALSSVLSIGAPLAAPGRLPATAVGAAVALGCLGFLAAAGLWRRARWARPPALAVAALNALSALPGVVSAPTPGLAAGAGATVVGMAVVLVPLLLPASQDAYAVLADLDRRLAQALPPEAVLPTIVETVATALILPYAAITLAPAGTGVRDRAHAIIRARDAGLG
jgi:hypothetical protein